MKKAIFFTVTYVFILIALRVFFKEHNLIIIVFVASLIATSATIIFYNYLNRKNK